MSKQPAAGPSTPLIRLSIHSSILSHLATELSFLQTLILRARDQHRTQLFLRRMYEVLRIGKVLLRYVKESNVESVPAEWEKKRRRGERLIGIMIKSVYTAQRYTSQIIELHHFLPLQTTVLSIYSRLFTITITIANGLSLDIEEIIASGGNTSNHHSRMKKRKIPGNSTRMDEDAKTILGISSEMKMDIDMDGNIELGEKIQRSSFIVPMSASSISNTSPLKTKPVKLESSVNSLPSDLGRKSASRDVRVSSVDISRPIKRTTQNAIINTPEKVTVRPRPPSLAPEISYEEQSKTQKRPVKVEPTIAQSPVPIPTFTKTAPSTGDLPTIKPKSKKLKSKSAEEESKAKKKKRKDAMDDIFGF
ncbi:uncharacterized protein IL334_000923 [Kwoniella shivajii]|uniref:Nucleolus and neural progenitor protein-like N-terminal domain-containing protein n=1 Tax=Kwoniella shivajii TaxID=564305 RepID=A0ABZ1CTK8_9TREE|nr:hypothetical protein IL334_000923 [Kwoniella shivajii]